MAVLKDFNDRDLCLHVEFLHRDRRSDQGCSIRTTSLRGETTLFVTEFWWTNETLNRFVESLINFPMEIYDGYFSHYDETFEMKWYIEPKTNLYLLIFFNSGILNTLKVPQEEIIAFGEDILKEMDKAPPLN
ncbi:hypothetical protein [Paenibacillus apiarius]|uniref:Uncharacterized protein n=1 Tax=Paenibacillus apiarius TaxID=46240 RepID=A0ABT4E4D3_9BACL|nr:hypothetical protein [Paenibacillus apiarius]MCY9516759.1 hypothetical protein [Paenibacillus apiarius]MCY9523198.1 hypothetical protein [Paenibacillus apiarius]MCY9553183.1 hypothetical protein [Paenibacillus apiarius]MCY9559625.1 hypothetical protein [Paenibacillus apiarius]MCY9686531.1 hypothetical protein [Paenibacillus apiarius]